MASDPVRLALIGAGRMGRVHLGALRESETVRVAGVVEPLAAARSELAAAGLEVWETVDDLLAGDRPEAVLIAAPSDQHPALVATFAGAGIPMLCEKPVGVRAADAIAASGRAEQAGVLLQVGYWRRFVAELRTLRDRIAAGELGDICQISCMQWDAEPPSEQFRAHSGGIAVDMGVHEFDQVRWLSGQEVTWATAAPAGPSTGSHAPTDPDAATILAGLSGGATATISLGRRFPFQDSCWAEVWETVDDLLAGDRPEAVLIAAPSDQHPALVATFAGAGIPMLCEKPVGVRAADAIAASTRAEQAGVLLQVGYWRRFVAELRTLRDRIAAGELGDICQISCMQWDAEPPSEQFRAHSGGIAVDMGVHEFDQVRWLSGQEVTWATAAPAGPSTGSHAPTDPDAATILAGLSGGATATISLGRRFPFQDSCWAEVWGTEGYARLPFMWDADGDEVFRSSMRRQAEGFARAVRGGPLEGAGGADAVAALTVAEWTSEALASAGRPAVRGLQS